MIRTWLGGCCLAAVCALAQPSQTITFDRRSGGPGAEPVNVWFSADSGGGEVVKGAPYSAEAVTETVQVLGDGNRIVRKNTSKVYRDAEGRKRQEMTINALGPWASAPITMVTIMDPVAKVMWELDTRERTARKIPMGAGIAFRTATMARSARPGVPPPPDAPSEAVVAGHASGEAGARTSVTVVAGEPVSLHTVGSIVTSDAVLSDSKPENLGKSTMEDVAVQGTRTKTVIPAGAIGNDRAIEMVHESWTSPDLKVLVYSKQTDPRMGETTYKLTNIVREEPAKSLFAPPADYTIKEGGVGPIMIDRVREKDEQQ